MACKKNKTFKNLQRRRKYAFTSLKRICVELTSKLNLKMQLANIEVLILLREIR